jgi:hypothetical protein
MRCDRGTTFATVLILLCCFGGTVGVASIVSRHAFVVTIAAANPTGVVKVAPASLTIKAVAVKIMCENDVDLLLHADIVELHNLPPPSGVLC